MPQTAAAALPLPLWPPAPRAPVRADMTEAGLSLDRAALEAALAALPPEAPLVVLIHGWRYAPGLGADCPHDTIYAADPVFDNPRVTSWTRPLRLDGRDGLALALGWNARCGLWAAHRRARAAGRALAELAARLPPGRRMHMLAHSLGARVALTALAEAPAGRIGTVILLAPAEARRTATAALASPAGRTAEVVNVVTRENDLFDAGFEWAMHLGLTTSLGQGLGRRAANWRDLWIDQPATLAALARLGHPLAPAEGRVCHWSPYLRPGALALYRALLDRRLSSGALPCDRPARRWSRLLARGDGPAGAARPA